MQILPMWKEFIFLQSTEDYYSDILAMNSYLDVEMLMADIFQIVFGLDFGQRTLGYVHGNLDIRKSIGYVKMEPCVRLQYQWNGLYYVIHPRGKMIKLKNMDHSSISINGTTFNAASTAENIKPNYNADLVLLGRHFEKGDFGKTRQTLLHRHQLKRSLQQNDPSVDQLWQQTG